MQKFLYFIFGLALVVPSATFAASSLPAVESKLVKNITYNSANVYAIVSPGTSEDNAYWFEWGMVGSSEGTLFKTSRHTLNTKSGKRDVTASLAGLSPDTQYYFRIVSENQSGTVSGSVMYFTTHQIEDKTESVVVATTRNAINIKEDSVTVYGYVAPHNSSAHYWFEWGTDDKTEFSSHSKTIGRNGGETTEFLTSLTPGTLYYYRQAAEGDNGTVYGALKSFKTKGTKPVVEIEKSQNAQKVSSKITKSASSLATTKSTSNKSLFASIFGSSGSSDSASTKNLSNTGSVANAVKDVNVSVKTISGTGNKQTVEYSITYKYNRSESATKAELRTTLPKSLTFAGDTTDNELLVVDAINGAKTYILPIGDINKGDTRTISIVAVMPLNTNKAPAVTSELSFNSKSEGKLIATSMVAGVAGAGTSMAFPTSMITFIVILIFIVIIITLLLKAKDLYKEAMIRAEESKKKGEEITKKIESNLINQDKIQYGNTETTTPAMAIPMKPTLESEYNDISDGGMGLPGMEVVQS